CQVGIVGKETPSAAVILRPPKRDFAQSGWSYLVDLVIDGDLPILDKGHRWALTVVARKGGRAGSANVFRRRHQTIAELRAGSRRSRAGSRHRLLIIGRRLLERTGSWLLISRRRCLIRSAGLRIGWGRLLRAQSRRLLRAKCRWESII